MGTVAVFVAFFLACFLPGNVPVDGYMAFTNRDKFITRPPLEACGVGMVDGVIGGS
jgi:hypothetical protein